MNEQPDPVETEHPPTSAARTRGRWWRRLRWILLAALVLGCLGLAVASRTPQGEALANIADYRLRAAWWRLTGEPQFDPSETGSIAGAVTGQQAGEPDGEPLAGAVVLVSSVQGEVYQDRSDERGRYRIDGVPPGRYVPLAAAPGYEEETLPAVQVAQGRQVTGVDFSLPPYEPSAATPTNLQMGAPVTASSEFPEPMIASRYPFTFTLDGLTINGGQVYLPEQPQGDPPPTLVIIYPSHPLNWNAASVALTREGHAVLAVGPDGDRGLDIEGHVRDFRAALQLWQQGELAPLGEPTDDWVAMSGSFGSLILFRALRDLDRQPPAIVNVGGVSDAFLGVQSLYTDREALAIPPPYDNAVAAMGRPDRDPAFFFAYSPVFVAGHLPRMLIIHNYNDEVIPYNQAEALAEALTEAGVEHELLLYEDTTHYLDAYRPTPGTFLVYERVLDFVDQVLQGGRP